VSSAVQAPVLAESAKELGRTLVKRGTGLVYGGGSVGLMGILAQSVLEGGGRVTGIIPRLLVERELAFNRLEDLRIVFDA
jgi:predicted Rossmann-fold nucleotide-binding protein